jgi:hypothetical protein
MAIEGIAAGHRVLSVRIAPPRSQNLTPVHLSWEMFVDAASKCFKESDHKCSTVPRDVLMQYAFQIKLQTFDFFSTVPHILKDFNTFMGNTMGVRNYWVNWFLVQALRALYVQILHFQATMVCFLSKGTFLRTGEEIVKWNDWEQMLEETKAQEATLRAIKEQWRDMTYQEECELQNERHKERIDKLSAIEDEVSRLSRVIKKVQDDVEREKLLQWLSAVDPSTEYNEYIYTIRLYEHSTGD